MALVGPILDDRTYEQLRDELVRRIPTYTPEWTDHNATDPGIALLELFAYLGESVLFRFNQIPESTKIAFLRLLGVRPRPAQLAGTLLTVTSADPAGTVVAKGAVAKAGTVGFETTAQVVAWPLEVAAVGRTAAPDLPTDPAARRAEQRRRDDALAWLPTPPADGATFYEVTAVPAAPSAPGATPLDVTTTVDGTLWIALVGTATTAATALGGRALFLGVAFDEEVQPHPFDLEQDPPHRLLRANELVTDPPGVTWELWNGPGRPAGSEFRAVGADSDSTRGLTTDGVVEIELPTAFPTHPPGAIPRPGEDGPPLLDDPKLADRVVGWLRARRPPTESDGIHRVRWVGVNVVQAVQGITAAGELLGTGTAQPCQTARLVHSPVVVGSVQLEVEEADGWRAWTETDDPTPGDRSFTLDPHDGTIGFGPVGVRVPELGERIRVTSYRYGGGVSGNVPAGAITSVGGVKAVNVLPAEGGADAPTVDEALDAVPDEVHRRDRAVTVDDTRALAEQVPGVARAEVLPTFHPDTPTQAAAGVLTVVVFPTEDRRAPGAPEPDVGLLRRVAAYLNPRRLLTAELYAVPPTYRRVAISVGLVVHDGYQVDAVRRWVDLILRQYLAPVPPYGPDGRGWPLGRAVRRAELEAVAVQVEGVDYLRGLLLAPLDGRTSGTATDHVVLEKWQVPEVSALVVVAGDRPPPPVGPDPGPPGEVLVPLPPDVC